MQPFALEGRSGRPAAQPPANTSGRGGHSMVRLRSLAARLAIPTAGLALALGFTPSSRAANPGGGTKPYRYVSLEALGSPGVDSDAYDVNNSCHAVGKSFSLPSGSGSRAMYWDPTLSLAVDLGDIGGIVNSAQALNNSDEVVGY